MTAIKFGTDGWRGIIAEDFTFANARVVAQAIARYVVRCEDPRKGVIIGYDHRFASYEIAAAAAPRTRSPLLLPKWCPAAARPFFWRTSPVPPRRFPCSCGNAGRLVA